MSPSHQLYHLLENLSSIGATSILILGIFVVFTIVMGVRLRFFPPRNGSITAGDRALENCRFAAIFRLSSTPSYVVAGFIMLIALLIGISTFSSSQASSDLLSFLWPLILLLLALYLIYRGRASAKRIFFDAQHVYLGKEEADARPETAYGGMYYNMRKAVSFNDLLAWRGTPNVIVFRKRLVWPIYFYYVIDTLFPASNANRQVFLLQMGQIVREAGGLPTPVRASDSNGYLQDDLLQFTLKRCEQNHIQVYRKDLYSLVPVVATLFFLGVGALILFPSLLRQF